MATYDTLEFNRDAFINVCIEEFDKILKQIIQDSFEDIEYFNGINEYTQFQGKEYYATFNDIRAWVVMFGQGQGMDQNNPYLDAYKQTSFWADGRPDDGTVVRRGADKDYYQYNYKTGQLIHNPRGSEPKGEALPSGFQKALSKKPEHNFEALLKNIYYRFIDNAMFAITNIENRAFEYFVIKGNRI